MKINGRFRNYSVSVWTFHIGTGRAICWRFQASAEERTDRTQTPAPTAGVPSTRDFRVMGWKGRMEIARHGPEASNASEGKCRESRSLIRVPLLAGRLRHLAPFRPWLLQVAGTAKTVGILLFMLANQPEQVPINERPERLRAIAVVLEKAGGKNVRPVQSAPDFQAVERIQGNAISPVEMAERLKNVGFALVGGVGVLGLRLWWWIRGYIFMNSHCCLL